MKLKMKRGMSLVLTVLMTVLSVTAYMEKASYAEVTKATYRVGAQSGPSTSYKNGRYYDHYVQVPITGDNRTDLVAIALSQLGYQEGAANGNFSGEVSGRYNYVEYSYNMGDLGLGYGGSDYPWCASFVSWCLYQSRTTDQATYKSLGRYHKGDYSYIWKEISCSQWVSQLKGAGYYKSSKYMGGSYTPKYGDLVFFQNSGGVAHIGICLYTANGRIYTVEGNTSDASGLEANGGGVYFKNYSLSSSYLHGYGVLPYKTNSSVPKIDYSGNNPTTGLYVTNSGKYVYSTVDGTSYSDIIPRFRVFEVTEVCSNGRLKVKYGDIVGYIKNNTDRVIQLSSTASASETVDPTIDERNTLKTLITKAEGARHYNYTEAGIENIRTAYNTAVSLVANTSATESQLQSAISALQTALNTTGTNTIAFNNEGIYINKFNKPVSTGDCVMYSHEYNGNGVVTADNANIRYTVNVVFTWDNDKGKNVVKSVEYGSSKTSITLEEGDFLIAAHEWENGLSSSDNPVKYSGTNYKILSSLKEGMTIKLSGASTWNKEGIIASTGVKPCAYAKFIDSDAVEMNKRNVKVESGDFTLFTPAFNNGLLTADNANINNTLNVLCKWDDEKASWVVDSKSTGTESIQIVDGQIVISALSSESDNYVKLDLVEKGDKLVFSGISPTSSSYVSIGANIKFVDAEEEEEEVVVSAPVNVALGKKYEAITATDNYNASLTDGITWTNLQGDKIWFAFKYTGGKAENDNTDENGTGTVVVDLEEDCDIDDLRMHIFAGENDQSIAQPESIKVHVSSNGTTYTEVGDMVLDEEANECYWAELNDAEAKGRYVKFEVTNAKKDYAWVFLNEIEIYGTPAADEDKLQIENDYNTTVENGVASTVIDLGTRNNINEFSTIVEGTDIEEATIYVSLDGINYVEAGKLQLVDRGDGTYEAISDNISATGRYVKVEVKTSSENTTLNEVEIKGQEYVQSETNNIALGMTYDVKYPVNEEFTAELTDGVATQVFQSGVNDSSWFAFHNTGDTNTGNTTEQGKGIVIVDLGGHAEITGTSIHMLAGENDLGAMPPQSVNVYVSDEKDGFYEYIGTMNYKGETAPYWTSVAFDKEFLDKMGYTEEKAYGSYIKFAFLMNESTPIEYSLFNEIQVYGTRLTSNEEVEPSITTNVAISGTFNDWDSTPNMDITDKEHVLTKTIELEAGTYEFKMLYGDDWYGSDVAIDNVTAAEGQQLYLEGNNCILNAKGGKYTFVYDLEERVLTITYEEEKKPAIVNATAPIITASPQGAKYEYNATSKAMTVTAKSTDGGKLTYQWYKNRTKSTEGATLIQNAIYNTLKPATNSVGTYYYYCIVTNTNENATGNKTATATTDFIEIITVDKSVAKVDAKAPSITANPKDITYTYNAALKTLEVKATSPDGGTLTYQWYKNTKKSTSGATLIKNATKSTIKPANTTVGTYYYYCVVTNTNSKATGTKTAKATSGLAKVTTTKASNSITGVSSEYNKNTKSTAFKLAVKAKGTIKFVSSNKNVATVNSNGTVTIKGVGTAYITIATGNENYKTVTKKIKLIVVPKKTTLSSVKSGSKKALTIKWSKNSDATSYNIQYSSSSSFTTKTTKSVTVNKSTLSKTIKSLTGGKKYYVRVRAIKKVGSTNYLGVWSVVKNCKTKK